MPGHADGDRARRVGLRGLGRDRVGLGRRGLRLRRRRRERQSRDQRHCSRAQMGDHRRHGTQATRRGRATAVRQFSTEHVAALGVLAVAAALAIATARRGGGTRSRSACRATLALVILAGWIGEQIADVVEGIWSVKYTLPLQLTDVVSVVAVAALLRPRPLLVELTWFWALTATLQAALTPDLARTIPSVFYFTYFAYHLGAIVAAFLLVVGERRYPRPGAAWRVFAVTRSRGPRWPARPTWRQAATTCTCARSLPTPRC